MPAGSFARGVSLSRRFTANWLTVPSVRRGRRSRNACCEARLRPVSPPSLPQATCTDARMAPIARRHAHSADVVPCSCRLLRRSNLGCLRRARCTQRLLSRHLRNCPVRTGDLTSFPTWTGHLCSRLPSATNIGFGRRVSGAGRWLRAPPRTTRCPQCSESTARRCGGPMGPCPSLQHYPRCKLRAERLQRTFLRGCRPADTFTQGSFSRYPRISPAKTSKTSGLLRSAFTAARQTWRVDASIPEPDAGKSLLCRYAAAAHMRPLPVSIACVCSLLRCVCTQRLCPQTQCRRPNV